MSFAWQTTIEDLRDVFWRYNVQIDDDVAERILGDLDLAEIERVAVSGGYDIEEQTKKAHDEIARQLEMLRLVGSKAWSPRWRRPQ